MPQFREIADNLLYIKTPHSRQLPRNIYIDILETKFKILRHEPFQQFCDKIIYIFI